MQSAAMPRVSARSAERGTRELVQQTNAALLFVSLAYWWLCCRTGIHRRPKVFASFTRYADGSHYIGPHSDDETQLAAGAPIFSISWGATRRFRLLPRRKTASNRDQKAVSDDYGSTGSTDACGASGRPAAPVKLDLEVANGDLVVMGGDCQKTHKHEVPKTRQLVGRRINATFRTFAKSVQASRINGSYP